MHLALRKYEQNFILERGDIKYFHWTVTSHEGDVRRAAQVGSNEPMGFQHLRNAV